MEPEIRGRFEALAAGQERIYQSVERTRKYLLWSFIIQLAMVLLPLVLLMIALPFLFSSLSGMYGDLL